MTVAEYRILHLSDPHFGTHREPVAAALVDTAKALAPNLLVLSGDITQRAHAPQFDAARRFVDALGIGFWLALPGNHDLPLFDVAARIWRPYAGYRRVFGNELELQHIDYQAMVLTADTTRAWRHKHGAVSQAQIERVETSLWLAHANQLRVVVTHQPPQVPRDDARKDLLRGHQPALAAWTKAGADLVLCGHIHLPGVVPTPTSSPQGRRAWVVLAGTAVSSRVRRDVGNSFNLIRWQPEQRRVQVERWDFVLPHASAGLHEGAWQVVSTTSLDVHR